MKKFIATFAMATLLFTATPAYAVNVMVENHYLHYQNDQPPVIQHGRTLVPLRSIFEALGATIEWDPQTQTVLGKKDGKTICIQINHPIAKVNGKSTTLDVPTTIIGNRTMVPVRFIAESMGAKVEWLQENQTVYVDSTLPTLKNTFTPAIVKKIIDGDTIAVSIAGKKYTLRMIGIDTPEVHHKQEFFGEEAAQFTKKSLALGSTVYLQKDVSDTDKYGRLLRYVWVSRPTTNDPTPDEINASMLNASLVFNGYAAPFTYPPDVKYADFFKALAHHAYNNNWGLWRAPENKIARQPVAPAAPLSATATTNNTQNGPIKGNINKRGERIYHLPGGKYYKKTHAEQHFNTEAEAQAAGYRPSAK